VKSVLHLILVGMVMLGIASPAFAHPLDEVVQSSYISIEIKRVEIELNISAGTLVAPDLAASIDTNGDHVISEDETQTYARRLQSELSLQVDGQSRPLILQKIDLPSWDLVSVGATIKAEFLAEAPHNAADHQVVFLNRHAPAKSTYQNTLLAPNNPLVRIISQRQNNEQNEFKVNYATGATSSNSATRATTDTNRGLDDLLAALKSTEYTPITFLLTLLLATVLGGAHALTPGHGKTVVAAYLVGSRGTIKHAIALGGMVTFTHTASVIVLGMVILLLSNTIATSAILPILEFASALLILLLGCQLLWQRWKAHKTDINHEHKHVHNHAHSHAHDHEHQHDSPHTHTHNLPHQISMRNLAMLAVSGGIVPCPEALGILLLAISINRIGFGLGLIVAFSLGLALVLIAMGVMLVSSKRLFTRISGVGAPLQRWLPLGSAMVITLLGASMLLRLFY
jgi:ABC-type nickel/cobalt efflux system permease component RcnA